MTVFFVIPGGEVLTERPGILDGPKASGKSRTILQGFELGFRVRVVIADMRATVGFGYPQTEYVNENETRVLIN